MTNSNTWACKDCAVDTSALQITPAAPVQTEKVQASTTTLPAADYLVVTWTEAETDAMGRVLGNGEYRFYGLSASKNNFVPLIIDKTVLPLPGSSELEAANVQCHAFYFLTKVGGKTVICLKSNFHPKKEEAAGKIGNPMQAFFKWLVKNNNFKYILTTGTSGSIWGNMDVGDVVVCNSARYDPNEVQLKNAGKPATIFTSGITNAALPGTLSGGTNFFDHIESGLNTYVQKTVSILNSKRNPANGQLPHIFYAPLSVTQPNTVITDVSFTAERANIDNNNYNALGATFDNNDAFVAEALESAGYQNWASIRNISDLPGTGSDSTYDKYQDCSALIGGLAAYAFIMGR